MISSPASPSVACFHLEEYEAALASFKAGASRDPSNTNFNKWIRKCEAKLAGTPRIGYCLQGFL